MNKRVSEVLAKRAAGEKGFTLIELLVVVIIMGILAAVAIPIFLNMRQGAWKSSVESDVANAVLAIEQAATANNGSLIGLATPIAGDNRDGGNGKFDITVGATGGEVVSNFTVSEGNELTITIEPDQSYIITGENGNLTGDDALYTYSSEDGSGEWTAAP